MDNNYLRTADYKKKKNINIFIFMFILVALGGIFSLLPQNSNNRLTNYAILTFTQQPSGDGNDTDSTTFFFLENSSDQIIKAYDPFNPAIGKDPDVTLIGDTNEFDIFINEIDVSDGTYRGLESVTTFDMNVTEKDLSDTSSYWINNLTLFNEVFVDFSLGRIKFSRAPKFSNLKTNRLFPSTDTEEPCWIQWDDDITIAHVIQTNGSLDGKYIRIGNEPQTEGTYYYINKSNITGFDGDPSKSSMKLLSVDQTTGSLTDGFGQCGYISVLTTNGQYMFDSWNPTFNEVTVTYKLYEDEEGPDAPVIWPEDERAVNKTINIIGYTRESNVTVKTHLIQDYEPYDYTLYNQLTTEQANIHLETEVVHIDINKDAQEFFIPLNNETETTILNYDYIAFQGFNKSYFIHYTISGTPVEVGGFIRIELVEPIENDIPIGTEVMLYDNK